MRIEITAQANSRDTVAAFIHKIADTLDKQQDCVGEKYGNTEQQWGYSWEIVPDKFDKE